MGVLMGTTEIQECVDSWKKTLETLGIRRSINIREEMEIGRAVQKWGAEFVELALFGARHEPKTEHFDPRNFVSLRRIFGKDKQGHDLIDRFANLGSQKRRPIPSVQVKPVIPEENYTTDPARIKELLGKAFGPKPAEEVSPQELERRKQDQLRRLRESEGK
jgi:hypothetical protein